MNKENLIKVKDLIDGVPEEKFDMTDWAVEHSCGTAFCIAGYATILAGYNYRYVQKHGKRSFVNDKGASGDPEVVGAQFLGLTEEEARDLFYGNFTDRMRYRITKDEALAELERMIADA